MFPQRGWWRWKASGLYRHVLLVDSASDKLSFANIFCPLILYICRSGWPRSLGRRLAAIRLPILRFRIPPGGMDVCCECRLLSGSTLTEVLCTFMIISSLILLRNISDKSCREIQITNFMFKFFFENPAVCEKMWKNAVELVRPQITI